MDKPEFKDWFYEFNTWSLDRDRLISLSYTPGEDLGDVVFTSPQGHVLTRLMCHNLIQFYDAAKAGWDARENAN